MAAVVFESGKNVDYAHDHMKGVKDLLDAGVTNSVPDKYVFPENRRPSVAQVVQGESIPIIDISGLDGSQHERLQTIQSLAQACAEWGFFRVINHGIEASLVARMLDVAHQFFSLTSEEKMKYGNRDVSDPLRYGTSFNTNIDQFFSWRDYLRHFCYPVLQTPDNPPNYRDVAGQYFKETRKMALKLMAAVSESLGLQPTYIETVFREGLQFGVVNFYPECPQPELTMGFAPHSDHGGLTILLQNEVGGLQVRHKGHWVAVEPVPNTFIVNVGDHLEIVSNGRYKSVEHRAVVNAERTRISIAAANGPALDALIFPAPQLVDETHPPLYRSMLYGEFARYLQTTELRGKDNLDLLKIPKQEQ
ncbi:flavanone 3-dioxygenase 2 [Cryptomeria japonica]|uniref:flavanone 3-dioxygenase 2 n=1 Tax=Cryptomeria japonica TaxID=3369 RepID=UPI0027DA0417|nr:flavanone 3-dioxygenase 2 [Cryptomeria japonica]